MIELSEAAPAAPPTSTDIAASAVAADPAATSVEGHAAATTAATTEPSKPEPEGKLIELVRNVRRATGEAAGLKAQLAETTGRLTSLEPVVELLALGKSDPIAAIQQFADAIGIDPAKAVSIMAAHGAGGGATETADERVARLERQVQERLAALDQRRADDEKTTATARQEASLNGLVTAATTMLETDKATLPLLSAETNAAREIVDLQIKHYYEFHDQSGKATKAGYVPMPLKEAAQRLEKHLQATTDARAIRLGYTRTAQSGPPSPQVGLSNSLMTASPAANSTIKSDEQIAAEWAAALGLQAQR